MLAAPYTPTDSLDDWRDTYERLCAFCAKQLGCQVVDGMIEMKDGGVWPAGGWVYDRGAGISCLSYEAKGCPAVSRQELRQIKRTPEDRLPPVCGGCAARKGTEASVARHTRKDFQAAVKNKSRFTCHETKKDCGGWCRAIASR